MEAPRDRRLRRPLRAGRLQLRGPARAAQLCALQESPPQGGAEGAQALLQVPLLHVREMPADGGPAAGDGAADGAEAGASAGRGARAPPRPSSAGGGARTPGATGGEGPAQPFSPATAESSIPKPGLGA